MAEIINKSGSSSWSIWSDSYKRHRLQILYLFSAQDLIIFYKKLHQIACSKPSPKKEARVKRRHRSTNMHIYLELPEVFQTWRKSSKEPSVKSEPEGHKGIIREGPEKLDKKSSTHFLHKQGNYGPSWTLTQSTPLLSSTGYFIADSNMERGKLLPQNDHFCPK